MIFYTVMPMEEIWEGAIHTSAPTMEVSVAGVVMEVEPLEQGRGRIVRLLQCPLDSYLNPALSPGAVVSLLK
ncbi:YlzJ-like family protein [Paenibacillus donghaensis]|uniref:YlzJ-like protein n=1 Tax=Paenibacillus donghaensis TaxID=414771 RepID=A0A2Z2KM44_9BACL|nr:YlzJ-like family protein [Paenibacillus donghaensis]ASA22202.1 hypothetical protein B9T62_16285 [Paenibacillus donghaensis]